MQHGELRPPLVSSVLYPHDAGGPGVSNARCDSRDIGSAGALRHCILAREGT
jgi:hypothetical protein